MDTARIPYPSHPYQSSANLASMLIQNGLSGISQHDLAQKIDLAGYYRLKGYWYPFLTKDQTNIGKRKLPFQPGTAWNTIEERYTFDQELRNIVFDGIVTIEVFLKSNISSDTIVPSGFLVKTGFSSSGLESSRTILSWSSLPGFCRGNQPISLKHPPNPLRVWCSSPVDARSREAADMQTSKGRVCRVRSCMVSIQSGFPLGEVFIVRVSTPFVDCSLSFPARALILNCESGHAFEAYASPVIVMMKRTMSINAAGDRTPGTCFMSSDWSAMPTIPNPGINGRPNIKKPAPNPDRIFLVFVLSLHPRATLLPSCGQGCLARLQTFWVLRP